MKDLLVIMCCTEPQGTMAEYQRQLADAGIDVHVEPMKDFAAANCLGAQVAGERELATRFRDYGKIMFSDAFDVLFYGTKADVLAKIPDKGVLLAAERNCYPDATLADGMWGTTPWRFVNGGLLAGTPDAILEWLDRIETHPMYNPAFCNQSFFNLLRFNKSSLMRIDDTTELFYCLFGERDELHFGADGFPVNGVCKTRPQFIHANGHWPQKRAGQKSELVKMTVEEVRLRGQAGQAEARKVILPPQPFEPEQVLGADVSRARVDVALCIPFGFKNADGTLRWIPPEFSVAMRMLEVPLHVNCWMVSNKGMKRDRARNELVKRAQELKAKYVWFIDDDNPPPPTSLMRLMYVMDLADEDVALCGGIYTTKQEPAMPLVFPTEGSGPYWKWRVGDVFECAAIATGCMMIRTSVFDHIPEPWFHDIVDLADAHAHGWFLDRGPGASVAVTDDMYFCKKVREAGFKMLAHGGVLPAHWGQDGIEYRLREDTWPYTGGVVTKRMKEAVDADAEPVLS